MITHNYSKSSSASWNFQRPLQKTPLPSLNPFLIGLIFITFQKGPKLSHWTFNDKTQLFQISKCILEFSTTSPEDSIAPTSTLHYSLILSLVWWMITTHSRWHDRSSPRSVCFTFIPHSTCIIPSFHSTPLRSTIRSRLIRLFFGSLVHFKYHFTRVVYRWFLLLDVCASFFAVVCWRAWFSCHGQCATNVGAITNLWVWIQLWVA